MNDRMDAVGAERTGDPSPGNAAHLRQGRRHRPASLWTLLVVDSENDAQSAIRALCAAGFDVTSRRVDTLAGVRLALTDEEWELVLCDYALPAMSCFDVLRLLQSNGPDPAVVILAGSIGEETVVAAIHAGASDVVLKTNLARLAPAVRRAISRSDERVRHRSTWHTLQDMFEALDEVLFAIDVTDGRFLEVSTACARVYGLPPAAFLADPQLWQNLVVLEDRSILADALAQAREGSASSCVYRIRRPDSHIRWLETRLKPALDDVGRPVRLAGITDDVTERKESEIELAAMATADSLTALPNHRALAEAIDREIERAKRFVRTFAVLFCDLDHFKRINDAWGHRTGDGVLREFGELTRQTIRATDVIGRWGGEEFLVVLPEVEPAGAAAFAERLRSKVASHDLLPPVHHLTCSIGVALFPHDGSTRDELVDVADRAMYLAKALGRNQVRLATDPALRELIQADANHGATDESALQEIVSALVVVVNARDGYTGRHSKEVGALAGRLAVALGLDADQARLISLAGQIHDIGKVAIPDAILRKPGALTREEWDHVRPHATIGADVVDRISALRPLAPMIRGHQERWDGQGYPGGLAGTAIPIGARILAVANAYVAMITDRPFRSQRTTSDALAEIAQCAGTQFDPQVVAALQRIEQEDVPPATTSADDSSAATGPPKTTAET